MDFILFGLTLLGVALSNMCPEAKSVGLWLRHGWHVAVACVIGYFALLFVLGWRPNAKHKGGIRLRRLPQSQPRLRVEFPRRSAGLTAGLMGLVKDIAHRTE